MLPAYGLRPVTRRPCRPAMPPAPGSRRLAWGKLELKIARAKLIIISRKSVVIRRSRWPEVLKCVAAIAGSHMPWRVLRKGIGVHSARTARSRSQQYELLKQSAVSDVPDCQFNKRCQLPRRLSEALSGKGERLRILLLNGRPQLTGRRLHLIECLACGIYARLNLADYRICCAHRSHLHVLVAMGGTPSGKQEV